MIVPMSKLSLFVYIKDRENIIQDLRNVGVVHIETKSDVQSEKLEEYTTRHRETNKVLNMLKTVISSKAKENVQIEQLDRGAPDEIIEKLFAAEAQLASNKLAVENLSKEQKEIEYWGGYNPDYINKLATNNIETHFALIKKIIFTAQEKSGLSNLTFEVVGQIGEQLKVVFFLKSDVEKATFKELSENSMLEIVHPPLKSIAQIETELKKISSSNEEQNKVFAEMAKYYDFMKAFLLYEDSNIHIEEVRLSMDTVAAGHVYFIRGWFPASSKFEVTEKLDEYSVWYKVEAPKEEDAVPVKLKNSSFAKLFEPITKILSLPSYFEIDPTPFFAPFFVLFFSLCLGDVGYGLVLLLIAIALHFKMAPEMKPFAKLGMIFGGMTILSGFLLNGFFGAPIFNLPGTVGAIVDQPSAIPALGTYVETVNGKNVTIFPAMAFAIYVGMLQMLIGMFLNGINKFKAKGAFYFISPLGSILLTLGCIVLLSNVYDHKGFMGIGSFTFGVLPVGWFFGTFITLKAGVILAGVGLALHILQDHKTNVIVQILKTPLALYNYATGFAGDGLSYLRLFAIGLSGGLLGGAFNQIAYLFITAPDGSVNWATPFAVFTVIVMVVGHVLNLGLSILGSFVHSLRLTFVEFYKNLQFTGGSKPYRPLAKPVKV